MLQLHFTSRRMIIISSSSYILLRWWSSQKRERERETKREKLLQPKPLWISWVVGRNNKKPSLQTFLLGWIRKSSRSRGEEDAATETLTFVTCLGSRIQLRRRMRAGWTDNEAWGERDQRGGGSNAWRSLPYPFAPNAWSSAGVWVFFKCEYPSAMQACLLHVAAAVSRPRLLLLPHFGSGFLSLLLLLPLLQVCCCF